MSHTVIADSARDCAAAYEACAMSAQAGESEASQRAASREFKDALERANEALTPVVTDLFGSDGVEYFAAGFETLTDELTVRVEFDASLADATLPSRASVHDTGFSRIELDEDLRGLAVAHIYASAA